MEIGTYFCIDGSASEERKRPIYAVDCTREARTVRRSRPSGSTVAFFREQANGAVRDKAIAILADVPIGLPHDYDDVYAGHTAFLSWLMAAYERTSGNWAQLVVDSVALQTPQRPFVMPRKGEFKSSGRFPKRECDTRTNGESLYWCVGGKQVGRAALQFWFEVLIPLSRELGESFGLWPTDSVTSGRRVLIGECHPSILQPRVYGRRVQKTDPLSVVDAVRALRERHPTLAADEGTWMHAVSSEDEFDMFTTAVALAQEPAGLDCGKRCMPIEGWIMGLADDRFGVPVTPPGVSRSTSP